MKMELSQLGSIGQAVDALISELAAKRVLSRDPDVMLLVRSSGIDVVKPGAARASYPGRPLEAVRLMTADRGARLPKDCALMFEPGMSITSRMVLPAESPEIIAAIVRNKVESIAPWPLAETAHGMRVSLIPGQPTHVAVDVAVLGRALLDDLAAALADAGTTVSVVRARLADEEAVDIDFNLEERIRAAGQRARRLGAGVVLVAGLVAAAGAVLLWRDYRELASDRQQIETLIAAVRTETKTVGATPLLAAANQLHARRSERPASAAVLNEISGRLPQTVWLENVSLDGVKLELKGQGTGIPALIGILEDSPRLKDVNFAAATQLNEELRLEAFSISATLETGMPGGEAQ